MEPGYKPQQTALDKGKVPQEPGDVVKEEMQGSELPQEAQEALGDIVDLFQPNENKSFPVKCCFALLRPETCKYLCSLHERRT